MKVLELSKSLSDIDLLLLILDEKGFSDSEIATIAEVSKQTIHNAKARNKELLEALKMVKSPPKEYGSPEVNKIVNAFIHCFGITKTSKYDRFAAERLQKKHGANIIVGAIQALSQHSNDKYAPSVNNVEQFEEKLPSIAKFLNSKSGEGVINL